MKRILIIALVALSFSPVFSQGDEDTRTFSIGPAVGFGHSVVRNTAGTDLFNPSWSAGVILNYSTTEHIGFAMDVLWSQEGSLVENEDNGVETDLTLQYLRVPLKFAYFFGDFKSDFRPKVTIGPSFGFLMDAQNDTDGSASADVTSYYSTYDIGVNASVGFNWQLRENMWLNTDLNYYNGFTDVHIEQYNSNLGLKVGLAFGL